MAQSAETNVVIDEEEVRQKLLWNVKREVKNMMEEAVMKKCIHEESCSVTTLCGAVEACLLHGLKRRAVGLFKTSTTMALLQKIARYCSSAAEVIKSVETHQRLTENSGNLFSFSKKFEQNRNRLNHAAAYKRYSWIRIALMDRTLNKIVDYIVNNSSKYYEPHALVYNCVQGPILASLLVGPCALEFTRIKNSDHYWTDPHADELVQRHRMHSSNRTMTNPTAMMISPSHNNSPKFRPRLQINLKRHASSSSEEPQRNLSASTNTPKEYVESLHQNAKSQLIYGKNNVLVQPVPGHDPIPGYLSLHSNQLGLTLKWTPNQLMNGCANGMKPLNENSEEFDSNEISSTGETSKPISVFWDYAISVSLYSIVYLHCHQHVDGDRIVLVGRDGVQYPPLHIKDKGGHLLAFLSCLESGLAPYGQLDPPLDFEKEQGKILPKLQHRTEERTNITLTVDDQEETKSPSMGDYVFRLIFQPDQEITTNNNSSSRWRWSKNSANSQSSLSPPAPVQMNSISLPVSPIDGSFIDSAVYVPPSMSLHKSASVRTSMASLCDTMRRQILSRAFYGWLAYCRHLKTVRMHLASLVYPVSTDTQQRSVSDSKLSKESWKNLFLEKQNSPSSIDTKEIFHRIYYGGCDPTIRKEVWPFLFSHYPFDSNAQERIEIDRNLHENYEKLIDQWQTAESLIDQINLERSNQRKSTKAELEIDRFAGDNGRCSGKTFPNEPMKVCLTAAESLQRKDSTISNEVFYEDCAIHTVTLGQDETSNEANPMIIIARTRTEPVLDRSSPFNIIDTSAGEETNPEKSNRSRSSSLNSTGDIYMDAVDVLDNDSTDDLTKYKPFTKEKIESFAANIHRIDKDVARCDRNYFYFTNTENLKKLRNIMCTYVWENLSVGYIQGMCDLVAPFLVTFDDEPMTYSCFCTLMKRLLSNFPHGTGMDDNFGHMRSLLQILDSELYEHIHRTGDFTHFYFCYRWFLLDFKREFVYDDIFLVWEVIAAAQRTVSKRFALFIALSMMKSYRDIILDHRMDFTDIIKFFNEMAERHDAQEILRSARELILELQKLIDNK